MIKFVKTMKAVQVAFGLVFSFYAFASAHSAQPLTLHQLVMVLVATSQHCLLRQKK